MLRKPWRKDEKMGECQRIEDCAAIEEADCGPQKNVSIKVCTIWMYSGRLMQVQVVTVLNKIKIKSTKPKGKQEA